MTQRRTPTDLEDDDGPSIAAKVAGAGEAASGMLPGAFQWLNVPISGVKGAITSQDEKEKYERLWGQSLEHMSHRSRGIKGKLGELKDRWKNNIGEAVASTGGAILGMVIGTALFPGVGTIAGFLIGGAASIIGGYVANKIYNKVFNKQGHDPLILVKEMHKMQRKGEHVPPEMIFAVLAANLPKKQGAKVDDLLEKETGTRLFHEALADPQNLSKIAKLMHDPRIDEYIRDSMLMPYDPQDTGKTVAEQLADAVNSGQMRAKDLLCPCTDLLPVASAPAGYGMTATMPMQPPLPFNPRGTTRSL